jgi:hypothetical protein
MANLVSLVLRWTIFSGVQGTFEKLPEGLLVLDGQDLKAVVAEWTILVSVEQPPIPVELVRNMELLENILAGQYTQKSQFYDPR